MINALNHRSKQQGAALVVSLIILVVLTIIGITAMRTSTLEERMSGNMQDTLKAFSAAESALDRAFSDEMGLTTSDSAAPVSNSYNYNNTSVTVTSTFLGTSEKLPRSATGIYGLGYKRALYDQRSDATTPTGGKSVQHRGVARIMNKAE